MYEYHRLFLGFLQFLCLLYVYHWHWRQALGGSSVALNEISTAALQVKEVRSTVSDWSPNEYSSLKLIDGSMDIAKVIPILIPSLPRGTVCSGKSEFIELRTNFGYRIHFLLSCTWVT